MLKEAIYHRPKNNFAYAYDENTLHIRLQTKKDDMDSVTLIYGDPYDWLEDKWATKSLKMEKTGSTESYDYWFAAISPEFRRMRYGFYCENEFESIYYT